MSILSLEIGKYYLTNDDKVIKIVGHGERPWIAVRNGYIFTSDRQGYLYTPSGMCIQSRNKECDIISEILIIPISTKPLSDEPHGLLTIDLLVPNDYKLEKLDKQQKNNTNFIAYEYKPNQLPPVKSFNWTVENINWDDVDSLEVSGVIEDGIGCDAIRSPDVTPTFWSVYTHVTGEGATCVADRDTRDEVLELANKWSLEHGVPVVDFTYKN